MSSFWKLLAGLCLLTVFTMPHSALAQNCPPGYTNNGLTCGRGASTIPNGGSRVADCPAGYTNNGATCGRGAHTISNGGSILADCPSGFRNMGASCYRAWPPKSLSMSHMTCPDGWFRSGGRCYKPCPDGYTNTGVSCFRPASTLGMDAMTCGPNEFKSGARCYKPCPVGFTNTGVSCFRPVSTLPRNSNIDWNPPLSRPRQEFYNIAHMANTIAAAKWAIDQGANGLEMDLNFDSLGRPTSFLHGFPCDCTCLVTTEHICSNGLGKSCNAMASAAAHLSDIAGLPGLALVYIDSKVDANTNPQAGTEVIRLLETNLFGNGYQGVVIVAAPDTTNFQYLLAAVREAGQTAHAKRYFFGFDQVRGPASRGLDVLKQLPGSPNLVYSTGITACLADTFYSEISGGVTNRVPGPVSLNGIWTIDLERSMINYLQLGVNAIVTNRPGILRNVLAQTQPDLELALPTDSPPLRP